MGRLQCIKTYLGSWILTAAYNRIAALVNVHMPNVRELNSFTKPCVSFVISPVCSLESTLRCLRIYFLRESCCQKVLNGIKDCDLVRSAIGTSSTIQSTCTRNEGHPGRQITILEVEFREVKKYRSHDLKSESGSAQAFAFNEGCAIGRVT